MTNISEQVQGFVRKRYQRDVAVTDSLLDSGLIDSVGIFELVSFLEERFGVQIPDEEIVPEHFETIENLNALVARLRAGPTA